jgi:rod shape-determining protein MreB
MRTQYNLIIGERMAEEVKFRIGNAFPDKKIEKMELKGRDAISGLPRTLEIDSTEIRKALKEPVDQILEAIKHALEKTPPELAADIVERGIVMTGGGSLLKGLDKYISKETGVPVIRAENPLTSVVLGAGKFLEELKHLYRSNLK